MNETTTSNQWDNWNFPLYIPENRLKRTVKDLLGKFALAKSPSLRKAILNGLQPKTLLERAAVMSLLFELEQKGEMESIAKIHRSFWASEEAFGYYQFTNERMNGMYELTKPDLLAAFQELLDEGSFKRVIEIGCGEGHVLEELSKELNSIDQFVGIDINKSQITATMNRFASNPKLSFLAGDALEYLDQNEVSNSILFTFGGVMEYFTERELKDFFTKLKLQKNIGIVLYEPIVRAFDPSIETNSIPYGAELSFCHPYSYYLKNAGFHVQTVKTIEDTEPKWMLFSGQT